MESFFQFVQNLHPFTQFVLVVLAVGGLFTSINYLAGRLTIMVRGYPPPHCCVAGEEADFVDGDDEDDDV